MVPKTTRATPIYLIVLRRPCDAGDGMKTPVGEGGLHPRPLSCFSITFKKERKDFYENGGKETCPGEITPSLERKQAHEVKERNFTPRVGMQVVPGWNARR